MKKCIECGKNFKELNIINNKKVKLKNRNKCLKCLPYKSFLLKRIKTKCFLCGKEIERIIKDPNQKIFCSQSCAAKQNNKSYPKRIKHKKCKNCDILILSKNTYCPTCIKLGIHLRSKCFLNKQKLSFFKKTKDANRYSAIRDHARKITKDRLQICHICGYDKHVNTCHIKSIESFSNDTLIEEINNSFNLVLLCKNHHWEMDNNYFCILF